MWFLSSPKARRSILLLYALKKNSFQIWKDYIKDAEFIPNPHFFFCLCQRVSMTVLIFIARAFIAGGFQAAYVYTPEVRYRPGFTGVLLVLKSSRELHYLCASVIRMNGWFLRMFALTFAYRPQSALHCCFMCYNWAEQKQMHRTVHHRKECTSISTKCSVRWEPLMISNKPNFDYLVQT